MLKTEIANIDKEEDEKRSKIMSTPSPEPQQIKKGRKKAFLNPNKKDKAGRTKLFSATTAGHLDKVKELIQSGADVNFKDNAGWTPLHEAALKGQLEIAKYLIECGAEVNVRGFSLDTPLHDACSSNSPECIQLLLDAGADVFALNEDEKRPIDLCTDAACQLVVKKKMKKLDQLIARDNQGRSSLHRACLDHNMDTIRSLIEQGADVNAKDNQDATPLHFAAALGHLDSVKALVSNGAIINILGNINSETPLHQASRHGHRQVVEYLISEGADVNMEDKHGNDPYSVSAAYPIIRQILTARMDEVRLEKESSNALDEIASKTAARNEPERQLTREERKIQNYMKAFASMDKPPLFEQVPQKRKKRVIRRKKSLSVESDQSSASFTTKTNKQKVLDPFKKDTSGRTLLHKYAKRGDVATLESLLELGGKPNEKDYAGWTPLHEAALNGHCDVVRLLLKYGADVNSKGADMDTPLHDATENNHSDVVEVLLEHGADPFVRNAHDAEPLDIALEHEFQDIILILQSANPVKKKKTKKLVTREELDKGVKPLAKKRRLKQAADLERTLEEEEDEYPLHLSQSLKRKKYEKIKIEDDEDEIEIKQEQLIIPTKKSYSHDIPPMLHSPIHTPPPDNWNSKSCYSPLYTVQHSSSQQDYYVIDLQVSLFLGISLDEFWSTYSYLNRKAIHTEGKIRLWSTLKQMIHEDKEAFVNRQLYFISLDDVLTLIKRDFNHLSANLLTITLDIGYEDETPRKKLPPKIAMKMRKCGYTM